MFDGDWWRREELCCDWLLRWGIRTTAVCIELTTMSISSGHLEDLLPFPGFKARVAVQWAAARYFKILNLLLIKHVVMIHISLHFYCTF